ncbi:MAG: response regulator transcription factor [Chloroflexota bacterium]
MESFGNTDGLEDARRLGPQATVKEKRIRVLIVDSHPIVRAGLAKFLSAEPDIDIIGTVANSTDAVSKAMELKPDVITLDAFVPPLGGIDALSLIREHFPEAKVLVLTVSERDEDLFQALRAGVQGYLLKSASVDEVAGGIRKTAAGEAILSPTLLTKLLAGLREKQKSGPMLTDRDTELLRLVDEGLGTRAIARRMKISNTAVRNRIRRILKKLYMLNPGSTN